MDGARVSPGVAGVVAGLAGLGIAHGAAHYLGRRLTPFDAVAELVIDLTPGSVSHFVIERFGTSDKPLLGLIIILVMLGLMVAAGRLSVRAWWAPALLYAAMGGFALTAALTREDATREDAIPVALGVVAWIVGLSLITGPADALRRRASTGPPVADASAEPRTEPSDASAEAGEPSEKTLAHTRRTVLIRAGLVGTAGVATALLGPLIGKGRRRVEQARRLLNLPATSPEAPAGVSVKADGVAPWVTANRDFYRIDTAFQAPAVDPATWHLRIHGMVEREVVLSYQDLLDREVTEDWITLNCVSNPVGGDLIGNAWWSGVRIAPLLAEAGVRPGADAVLQKSWDGWTCGTPLAALTDDRQAMIAFGMNGEALPIEHGFPARTIVPGLYGFVSACKWVVSLEVTRFDRIEAYWTGLGWSEQAPLKMSSRIDVPRAGQDIEPGELRIGGVAWAQHTGIDRVEYAVDGGPWIAAELGALPRRADGSRNLDTWVQWASTIQVEEGDHELRVRAVDSDGVVQSGVVTDVRPDGATGWHTREFTVG